MISNHIETGPHYSLEKSTQFGMIIEEDELSVLLQGV